jgi:hypothetical protein
MARVFFRSRFRSGRIGGPGQTIVRMREKVTDRLNEMRLRERERVRATPRADCENKSFNL